MKNKKLVLLIIIFLLIIICLILYYLLSTTGDDYDNYVSSSDNFTESSEHTHDDYIVSYDDINVEFFGVENIPTETLNRLYELCKHVCAEKGITNDVLWLDEVRGNTYIFMIRSTGERFQVNIE